MTERQDHLFAFLHSHKTAWIWNSLIGLAFICQVILIWLHVPWADELQATSLARANHSLSDWYWNFRYEGHPPLWHLLLSIPLAFTDDPTALKIVQSIFVAMTSALLYFRSPFPPFVKFLLSCNYFLFFEYGVIARDYTLTVFVFFLFIDNYKKPIAWPLIALLALSSGLQSLMLAGLCGLIALKEQGWRWGGVLLACLGAMLCLIWMWPQGGADQVNEQIWARPWSIRFWRSLYMLGTTVFPVNFDLKLNGWDYASHATLIFFIDLCCLALIVAVVSILKRSTFKLFIVSLFIAANFLLSVVLYALDGRHFGFWVILFIGCLWLEYQQTKKLDLRALVLLVLLSLGGLGAAMRQVIEPFAIGTEITNALKELGGLETMIIPVPLLTSTEVHGHLRKSTYDVTGQCMQSFIRWRFPIFLTDQWVAIDPDQRSGDTYKIALSELKKVAARAGGHALLLLTYAKHQTGFMNLHDSELTYLQELQVGESDERQIRYIFRIDVAPDPNPKPIPACGP